VTPQIYFGGAISALTAVRGGESSISEATVITENNDDPMTVTVDGNFQLSLDQQSWATSLTLDASGETFYVRLADTSEEGSYEGTITATAGAVTAYADVAGEVTLPASLIGDVNMDGQVNISDVITLINFMMGSEVNPFDDQAADVNYDGNVNISDVTALISSVLTDSGEATMWNAMPSQGGIKVFNPLGETLEVYDLDANRVATIATQGIIALPRGTYMVTSDSRSRKVVVK